MARLVVVVKGSPRRSGNSALLADQAAAGARDTGAEVETIYVHGLSIKPCAACDSCQETMEKDCIVKDDMQPLYPLLRRADALVIASPVYWFTLSAQAKLFIDRGLYPLNGPQGHAMAGKQIALLLTYGDSDPFNSGAVNALRAIQDMARFIGAEFAGAVYGSASAAGEISQQAGLLTNAYRLGQRLGGAG